MTRDQNLERLVALQPGLRTRFRATLPSEARAQLSQEIQHVTIAQVEALKLLHGEPAGVTMQHFATGLGIGASAATQLADRLVRQGLAERDVDGADRRVVRLLISATARGQFDSMIKMHVQALSTITEVLNDQELQALVDLLDKLARPIDARETEE